jgi:hypothetical protein
MQAPLPPARADRYRKERPRERREKHRLAGRSRALDRYCSDYSEQRDLDWFSEEKQEGVCPRFGGYDLRTKIMNGIE